MDRQYTSAWLAVSMLGGLSGHAFAEAGEPDVVPVVYDDAADRAREVLRVQEQDESDHLDEVLTAADRNYSLVRRGEVDVLYQFNYDYVSTDRLDIELGEEGRFTRFDVERDAEHAIRNSFTIDYGLLDNLSVGVVVSIVSKYNTLRSEHTTTLGDLGLRARWQPWQVRPGRTNYTVFGDVTLPTGRSPYKIDVDDELSTGSGFYGLNGGLTLSRVVDPAVAFGSISAGYKFPLDDLDQVRGNRILQEVDPGYQLSFSMGMAYALSYDVSLTLQYQQTLTTRTEFVFDDGTVRSDFQNAGLFSVTTGWRLNPWVIMSVTVGIGQTGEAPDIVLGVSLPITYGGLSSSRR